MCGKKPYRSKKHAREGSNHMHETIRVYWCNDCKAYHTTQERYSNKVQQRSNSWRARAQKRRNKGRT